MTYRRRPQAARTQRCRIRSPSWWMIAGERIILLQASADRLGVGVEEQFLPVVPMPILRLLRPVHAGNRTTGLGSNCARPAPSARSARRMPLPWWRLVRRTGTARLSWRFPRTDCSSHRPHPRYRGKGPAWPDAHEGNSVEVLSRGTDQGCPRRMGTPFLVLQSA